VSIPHFAFWQWALGIISAFCVGLGKTGAPGVATLIVPLMVVIVGDARFSAAWTLPILSTADVFAVWYWRRHAEAKTLFALVPWVLGGMALGTATLKFPEPVLRRIVITIVVLMLITNLWQRWRPRKTGAAESRASGPTYGVVAGFATVVANAAGPVMNLYLLSKRLPKEIFVATGAWFFLVVNLSKIPIYASYGLFSSQSLTFNLMMAPIVIAGAMAGRWVVQRTPQRVFDLLIIAITALSIILLIR
jgi:uncharacterized protein